MTPPDHQLAVDGKVNVRATPCENCLLSRERLVTTDRAREIIRDTRATPGATFICHRGQVSDEPDSICRAWWDAFALEDHYLRIVMAYGLIREIHPQPTEGQQNDGKDHEDHGRNRDGR